MQTKKIIVKEVFKSTSTHEIDKFLRDKIVKLMMRQQIQETKKD